jgi:hypothetical protein
MALDLGTEHSRKSDVKTLLICKSTLLFFIRNIGLPGEEADAALIIRNPRLKKTVIVPQRSYHIFALQPEEIFRSCHEWAKRLLPHARLTKREYMLLADSILNGYGDLLKHQPDAVMSFQKVAEQYGLKLSIQGETVLDASH